jgi:7-keto-8-aminopelargonate synthetase-like enzyme
LFGIFIKSKFVTYNFDKPQSISVSKTNQFFDTVNQIVSDGVNRGILHLYTEDNNLSGNYIVLKGKRVVNFGSCSYLGLEFDERLKNGAKEAIDNYGTQFSESRAYVSVRQYQELEALLGQIFEAYPVVMPTTTLGHIANIPVLVGDSDAIIMDHQVHSSVQTAVQLLKARGVYIELLRHNRLDMLEDRIKTLRNKYKKIWYMADGIYSMYGDKSPVKEIYALLDKYPQLYYYADDAHGMSIHGKHGRGYVLNNHRFHPKLILGTSLNKAFAAGGGVMLYPDAELARKVRTCGGPLITSGPMQPGALGAAVASAKIHLSPDITEMQQDLQENIRYALMMVKKHGLPLISEPGAAVFFIGVSLPKLGYNMVRRMLHAGYYLNLGIFPAVPMKNTGIRFTITRLHTFEQIESMIATMAEEFPQALAEEGLTMEQIYRAFKLPIPEEAILDKAVHSVLTQSLSLTVTHKTSITEIDKILWNSLFEDKGNFDWESLKVLEASFTGNALMEDNWKFDYVIVKDSQNRAVAATFFSTALYKDDMLTPAGVSRQIELKRSHDPYYLTSTVIASGSLITEGEHLYIDRKSVYWKDAMQLIFEKVYLLQERHKAATIMLRDFTNVDEELDTFFVDNGFFKMAMPESYTTSLPAFGNVPDFLGGLSANSRKHFRKYVQRHSDKFITQVHNTATEEDIDYWYTLYSNTQKNSLALNTFALPKKLFANMLQQKEWEVLTLTIKPIYDYEGVNRPVAVIFSKRTGGCYMPLIIGMNYVYKNTYYTYRQALYQVILRSIQLNCTKVRFGFSAGIEKKKVGAAPESVCAYMQTKDTYNIEVIAALSAYADSNRKLQY